ncbi:MAG: hypothetical protein ABW321_29055, partial [Polyangiales bacterium]
VCENLFTPITLAAVLLLLHQKQHFARWRLGALWLLALLLPLAKVAALSSCVFLVMWAFSTGRTTRERWANASAIIAGTCCGVAAHLGYGVYMDRKLFDAVMTNHQHRFGGFHGFGVMLFNAHFIKRNIPDLLFVASTALALGSLLRPCLAAWGLAVLVYAGCMCFFVDHTRVFSWYYIPLYPWMCAGLGAAIAHASRQRVLGLSLLWCTIAWLTIIGIVREHEVISGNVARYGYLLGLLTIYGAWTAWPKLARISMPAVNGAMVAGVAAACVLEIYMH